MNICLLKKTVIMPLVMGIMAAGIFAPVNGQAQTVDEAKAAAIATIRYNIAYRKCLIAYEECVARAMADLTLDEDAVNAEVEKCKKTKQECIKGLGPAPKSPN